MPVPSPRRSPASAAGGRVVTTVVPPAEASPTSSATVRSTDSPQPPGALPPSAWIPDAGEPAGVTLTRLAVVLVGVIGVIRLVHLSAQPAWALLGAVAVLALAASGSRATVVAGAALVWLLGTGFVAHRFGELALAPDDRAHLVLVAVAAVVTLAVRERAVRPEVHRG